MASVMAIVSRAVFERMVPKGVKVGDVVATDRYTSAHKTFEKLADDGSLFLVTVRPPDERLWLVAVLERPKHKGSAWVAAANKTPIADITGKLKKLVLSSGQGIAAKKGALGMSLQTPRVLTDGDERLLRSASTTAKSSTPEPARKKAPKITAQKTTKKAPAKVSWDKLKHARGAARRVPELLDELPSKAAFEALAEAFNEAGQAFSASAALFGALVDRAAETEQGEELLAFALNVVALFELPKGFRKRRYATPDAASLLEGAHEKSDALVALLADTRPQVRSVAAMILGFIGERTAALSDRLARESDPGVRASLVFALMDHGQLAEPSTNDPVTRGAALIARAKLARGWPDIAKSHDELVAFFEAAVALAVEQTIPSVADRAFAILDAGDDTRFEAALCAMEALARAPIPYSAKVHLEWAQQIRTRWFPGRGSDAHIKNPVDVTKLGERERRILAALSLTSHPDDNWKGAGLPPDPRSRRRLLGLQPPSLIDDVITCAKAGAGKMPRWRAIRRLMDQYDKLENPPPLHHFVKQHVQLGPAEWLEAWAEVHAEVHGMYCFDDPDPLVTAFDDATPTQLRAWATRYLDEIVGAKGPFGPDRELRADLGAEAYRGLIRAGAEIPERYDHAMTLFVVEEELPALFEAIPRARRLGVIKSIYEFHKDGPQKNNFSKEKVEELSALIPGAAEFLKEISRPAPVKKRVAKKKVAKKKVAKKAKVSATYRFVGGTLFDEKAAGALQGVAREQFLSAVERFGEEDYELAKHWTIVRLADKSKPYEMWTFMVDNGTVFIAGTAKHAGVEMIQGGFESTFDTPETRELADELQEVVPF